jgi:hypothetical protein
MRRYERLSAQQMRALVLQAPGGPEASNNAARCVILRAMSEDDQEAAFIANNIVRPVDDVAGPAGGLVGQDDAIAGAAVTSSETESFKHNWRSRWQEWQSWRMAAVA